MPASPLHAKNPHSSLSLSTPTKTNSSVENHMSSLSSPSSQIDGINVFRIRFSVPLRIPAMEESDETYKRLIWKIFLPINSFLKKGGRFRRSHRICLRLSVSCHGSPLTFDFSKTLRKFSDHAELKEDLRSRLIQLSSAQSVVESLSLSLVPLEEAGGCDGREHRRKLLNSKVVSPKSRNNNCLINCIIIATGTRFMKGYQINFLRNKLKIPHKAKIPWNSDWVQKICNFFRVQLEIYSRANELLMSYSPQTTDETYIQGLESKVKAEDDYFEQPEDVEDDPEDEEDEADFQQAKKSKERMLHGLSIPKSSERQTVKLLLFEEHYYLITDMLYTKKKCSGCGGVYIKKHKCTLKPNSSPLSGPMSPTETSSSEVDDRIVSLPSSPSEGVKRKQSQQEPPESEAAHQQQHKRPSLHLPAVEQSNDKELFRLPGIDSFPDIDLSPVTRQPVFPNFPHLKTSLSSNHQGGVTHIETTPPLKTPLLLQSPPLPFASLSSMSSLMSKDNPVGSFCDQRAVRKINHGHDTLSPFYPAAVSPQIYGSFISRFDDKMSFSTTSQRVYFSSPFSSRSLPNVFPS